MRLASAPSYANERAGSSSISSVTNERVSPAPVVIKKSSEPFSSTNDKGQDPQPDLSAALSLKDRIQKHEQRLLEVQFFFPLFSYMYLSVHM
jgi:hypothetical protein